MITRTSTTNAFRRAPRVGVDDNRIGIHVEPRRNRIGIHVEPRRNRIGIRVEPASESVSNPRIGIRVKPAHRNPCQTRASDPCQTRASDPCQTRASESVSNPRIGIRVKPASDPSQTRASESNPTRGTRRNAFRSQRRVVIRRTPYSATVSPSSHEYPPVVLFWKRFLDRHPLRDTNNCSPVLPQKRK